MKRLLIVLALTGCATTSDEVMTLLAQAFGHLKAGKRYQNVIKYGIT